MCEVSLLLPSWRRLPDVWPRSPPARLIPIPALSTDRRSRASASVQKGKEFSYVWTFGNLEDGAIAAFVFNSTNSWVRVNENTISSFAHLMQHDATFAYCPESVILAGKCIPPDQGGTPWYGSGQFTRNGRRIQSPRV